MFLTYIALLLLSILGVALLDRRFKLAFWYDKKRSWFTIGCGVGIFVLWDIAGIMLGIFLHGQSPYQLGFTLFPEFPLEEIIFLFLLCYSALALYRGAEKWLSHI